MKKRKMIRKVLNDLGLSPHMRGTRYLEDAVYAWRFGMLLKELYPAVGRMHGVPWTTVERAIRTALDYAWEHERGNTATIVDVFGVWALHERPMVGQAIASIGTWVEVDEDQD